MPEVTLRTLAKAAQLSPGAVSLALRNHPRIGEATRARVQKLAETLGYKRNPMVSAWMQHRRSRKSKTISETIAFLCPRLFKQMEKSDSFYCLYWQGAKRMAEQLGYRLEKIVTRDYKHNWASIASLLRARGIRGVVLGAMLPAIHRFEFQSFCIVGIEPPIESGPVDFSIADHYEGLRLAWQMAREAGWSRIGYVESIDDEWRVIEDHYRWAAAFLHLQREMRATDRIPILEHDLTEKDTLPRVLARWLKTHRPQVVIAVQPIVWQVLKELDFRIPRDLNFVSLEWRPSIGKEIAGVDQRLDKVGEEAVRLVAQKLEQNEMGLSEAPRAVFVRPVWHAGATLARNR